MRFCHPQMRTFLITLVMAIACGLTACQANPAANAIPADEEGARDLVQAGSCGLSLPDGLSTDEKLAAVLQAEGNFVVAQDIERLMALWQPDSQVIDARNTPQDTTDDQVWDGVDAVRHRYLYWVFPGAPSAIAPQDLKIELLDGKALITSTTRIDNENAPGGDRWELQEREGCWLIAKLTYNLEE